MYSSSKSVILENELGRGGGGQQNTICELRQTLKINPPALLQVLCYFAARMALDMKSSYASPTIPLYSLDNILQKYK